MKNTEMVDPGRLYQPPFLRIIETEEEHPFLQSNLEPIGGGDDPDIDW